MSDTNSPTGQTVPIWRMAPRYEAAVMESLGNSFGAAVDGKDLPSALLETADILAEDNAADYLAELAKAKTGSYLEDLDDLNTEVWLKTTLKNSVAYMLLARCGYDPRAYFSADDFTRVPIVLQQSAQAIRHILPQGVPDLTLVHPRSLIIPDLQDDAVAINEVAQVPPAVRTQKARRREIIRRDQVSLLFL